MSVIITMRWMEPCPGEDAKVADLTVDEEAVLSSVVEWLEGEAGQEWGDTIPRVDMFATEATGGEIRSLRKALEHVATGCRYDTGEEIYGRDCPALAERGIARS